MLMPWVMTMPADVSAASAFAPQSLGGYVATGDHAGHLMSMSAAPAWIGVLAVGVHTASYLGVMTLAALIVYRRLGLAFLRAAWLNLDWVWAGALVVTGIAVLLR